jgi:hypothetical protein
MAATLHLYANGRATALRALTVPVRVRGDALRAQTADDSHGTNGPRLPVALSAAARCKVGVIRLIRMMGSWGIG